MKRGRSSDNVQKKNIKESKSNADDIEEVYSSKEFWDQRYKDGYQHAWYYSYKELEPLLKKYVQSSHNVLEVGCGDSPIIADLYNDNEVRSEGDEVFYVGVDYSETIINTLNSTLQKTIKFTWIFSGS